jgi:hypothetical protein
MALLPALVAALTVTPGCRSDDYFERIATFPVYLNSDADDRATAEVVDVTDDGQTLVYTDSGSARIGFVNISDPRSPRPDGVVRVDGAPTSVAVAGRHALVAVNRGDNHAKPAGALLVIDLRSREVVRSIDLGGQPDSVAVSGNRRWAAVAVENEANERLCVGGTFDGREVGAGGPSPEQCRQAGGVVGGLPQAPGGFVVILRLKGGPAQWSARHVDLTGVAGRFPDDPEPEFVDIGGSKLAAVTLQENNHLVLIDLRSARVRESFSGGLASLDGIDTRRNSLIELNGAFADRPREADGVTWISRGALATADEGESGGGTRGFTIYDRKGKIRFQSANELEHLAVRLGHYPEQRSEKKGGEPESVEYARYGKARFLFVGCERSNVVAVYKIDRRSRPRFHQVLPTGVGPESLKAVPKRRLLVVANEVDDRDGGLRSCIGIYRLRRGEPTYPTLVSANRRNGKPIPWGALSGLAADPHEQLLVYAVHDDSYRSSSIFKLDVGKIPAVITDEIVIRDADGNDVHLDAEGLAVRAGGGFWLACEGAGSVDDPARPVTSPNALIRLDAEGVIHETILLPGSVDERQRRFGFEGVAATGTGDREMVYVAFQRPWVGDPEGLARIGRYETATGSWTFFHYPLEKPTSPAGGWVGLSELEALDGETFAVIERDNQAADDARIKRIYRFSIRGLEPQPQGGAFPRVRKALVRDLLADLAAGGGQILEKVEGLTVTINGEALIVTDNDAVSGSNGETQLIRLGRILTPPRSRS